MILKQRAVSGVLFSAIVKISAKHARLHYHIDQECQDHFITHTAHFDLKWGRPGTNV